MFLKDLTANKVFIPAALFMALSPGVLLTTDGTKISYKNGKTDQMSVLVHALVFLIVYSLIAKAMGLVLTKADLIVTATLFVILSPGLLLTLPPGSGGVFRSGQTSMLSVVLHSIVLAVLFAILRRQYPQFY
jgi:hypothetical protein|tara:strand:+ start:173 stop:568 length:396 start_codon:yes stop_codon:yes gene_type:complete